MSVVHVEAAGQELLERAQRLLAGIPGGVDKAVRSAMARSVSHLRTTSTRVIRERYDIKAEGIRAEQNVKVRYDYRSGVQASVIFAGRRIPLYRFNGTSPAVPTPDVSKRGPAPAGGGEWRYWHPSVPAYAHVLKSTSPVRFPNAFVATMKSGHTGIFERTGGATSEGRDQIQELFGPSVPQMLGNEEVQERLSKEAMETFEERLDHEINAILYGWRTV